MHLKSKHRGVLVGSAIDALRKFQALDVESLVTREVLGEAASAPNDGIVSIGGPEPGYFAEMKQFLNFELSLLAIPHHLNVSFPKLRTAWQFSQNLAKLSLLY